jgi:hypothetical protein
VQNLLFTICAQSEEERKVRVFALVHLIHTYVDCATLFELEQASPLFRICAEFTYTPCAAGNEERLESILTALVKKSDETTLTKLIQAFVISFREPYPIEVTSQLMKCFLSKRIGQTLAVDMLMADMLRAVMDETSLAGMTPTQFDLDEDTWNLCPAYIRRFFLYLLEHVIAEKALPIRVEPRSRSARGYANVLHLLNEIIKVAGRPHAPEVRQVVLRLLSVIMHEIKDQTRYTELKAKLVNVHKYLMVE